MNNNEKAIKIAVDHHALAKKEGTPTVVPLYDPLSVPPNRQYISFSIFYESRPEGHSLATRTITKFDILKKLWLCECCKRRGCPHKIILKWYIFQTNESLLSREESIEEDNSGMVHDPFDSQHPVLYDVNTKHYPPADTAGKTVMMDYWLENKSIPFQLPKHYMEPSLSLLPKDLLPREEMCHYCKVNRRL